MICEVIKLIWTVGSCRHHDSAGSKCEANKKTLKFNSTSGGVKSSHIKSE